MSFSSHNHNQMMFFPGNLERYEKTIGPLRKISQKLPEPAESAHLCIHSFIYLSIYLTLIKIF